MSVYVEAKTPQNTFTYKSSFIQDTIENASETWMNRPKMRKGIKRVLDIEETPFICTPKLIRTRSIFTMDRAESEAESPPKRAKLSSLGVAHTPQAGAGAGVSSVSRAVVVLLHVPDVCVTDEHAHAHAHVDRAGAGTPHSILKIRRNEDRDAPSPVDSRYLGDSDDELLETASNHTHYSDSTNKHLRFTIPTASESGSTPSPTQANALAQLRREPLRRTEPSASPVREQEIEISSDSYTTSTSRFVNEKGRVLESPSKEPDTEETTKSKKTYKDNVRARHTLSVSVNSSLTDTSMESIADIPITLINPRYSGEKGRQRSIERDIGNNSTMDLIEQRERDIEEFTREKEIDRPAPATPKGRRSIRSVGESTPLVTRSQSGTPDRLDSPVVTPLRTRRTNRSRSRTPS
ncbi:uncharacterized protein LOC119191239 [Manduca sexta]|uniref:uncharacterized protein LOC119191239 n=1 Tax=Manduca sexta TaxID=7130 RepID=UPI00188E4271|nr:uncharacterized protein LOC119191239 [Manduca sexta]